jgi:surfeit locus 1 family protein
MSRLRPAQWAFAALTVLIGAACIRLGLWQLDRLDERRQRNQTVAAKLDQPVVELTAGFDPTQDLTYRRLRVRGTFDAEHEILLTNRSYSGQAGVHLITPLQIDGTGSAILVDRGWIPASQAGEGERRAFQLEGPIEVSGLGRPSQSEPSIALLADPTAAPGSAFLLQWRFLHLPSIQQQVPYELLPVVLEATEPISGQALPRPQTEIDLSDGPHLSYAIQWFAFATIAFLGGAAWLARGLARPRTAP